MSDGLTTFDLNQPDLPTLLQRVESGEVQLPDFQRGWVWKEDGIRALIASVTMAYPIGAILMLKTGGARAFHPRPIEGAPRTGRAPDLLILDGQQRVTSLFQALRMDQPVVTRDAKDKEITRWFYLDIRKCLDPDVDRVDAVLGVPEDRVVRVNFDRDVKLDLSAREKEFAAWMMPARDAFDAARASQWMTEFIQHHGLDNPGAIQGYIQFQNTVLRRLQTYRVPSIELAPGTPHDAVCQVFENVNTGGVALSIFDLLTAMFSAEDEDFRLRVDWFGEDVPGKPRVSGRMQRLHERPVLRAVRERDFVQACTLLSTYEAHLGDPRVPVACARKDILKLKLDNYRGAADRVEDGFIRAARMLGRLKIYEERNVPYSSQLVPLAAILARLGGREESEAVRARLDRWYWCGVFGELYGSSTETRMALDIAQVLAWIEGADELPRTVRDINFAPTRLLDMRTRNSAAYKGVAALLLVGGCRDLARGDEMGDVSFERESIDIHHLFPKRWCEAQGIPPSDYNSVINRSPIAARTNKRIGGNAPSSYLARLEGQDVTAEALDGHVRSHLASPELLRVDAYQEFKVDRARRLLDRIERVTGKEIDGRDAEAVRNAFGAALPRMPAESDAPAVVLFGRYAVIQEIHGGGMARAYKVYDRETKRHAFLKRVHVDGSLKDVALQREIAIYQKLERAETQGTLRVLDVHHDDRSLALVTELATGGTLANHVHDAGDSLPPAEVKRVGTQILSAIRNLHALEIVHRDIKPENVLRVGDAWKLGDFGLAKNLVRMHSQRTLRGGWSPGYAPEEQIAGAEPAASMDVYAFGKLLTFMLTGQTDTDQVQNPRWRELVRRCAQDAPEERPPLDAVARALDAIPA
jgi:hypothetical protein